MCWANWRQWFSTQSAHTAPHARTSSHTALPHSSPHNSPHRSPTCRVPPHSSPHSPQGTARPTGTGEGAKHISASEECEQCEGAHEYTLPAHRGEGLSHVVDCCHLTACSDSVKFVHNDYRYVRTYMCVYNGCKSDKGSAAEVHRECTRDASTEWTTHVALTWCVAGHCQRA